MTDRVRSIDRVEVVPYTVAFRAAMPLSTGVLHARAGYLLGLVSGTTVGWGEAAPLPGFSDETDVEAGVALEAVGRSLGGSAVDIERPLSRVSERFVDGPLPPSVRFAVELAVVNLAAACRGVPPARVLEPGAAARCDVAALVTGTAGVCVRDAGRAVDRGFTAVKLKVGRRPVDEDAARVRDVAGRIDGRATLRLDANRAWSPIEARRFAEATAGVTIEFIEEPLSDPAGLPLLARDTGWPVALDETILREPRTPVFDGLAAVVLKPTLLGGIVAARTVADRYAAHGVGTVVSSCFESGVGLYGLAALAASLPPPIRAAGLGTAGWFARDTIDPAFPAQSPSVEPVASYRIRIPARP